MAMAAAPKTTLIFDTQAASERPTDRIAQYTKAREFADSSSFLNIYFPLKLSIYNCDPNIQPALDQKGQQPDAKAVDSLAAWMAQPAPVAVESVIDKLTKEAVDIESSMTNGQRILKFVEDVWNCFFLFDACPAVWMDTLGYATVVRLENCTYSDNLGIETLRYQHGLSTDQIAQLPPDRQDRFKKNAIIPINPAQGEHFRMLKRSAMGEGLGTPRIFSIFRLLGEVDSKEIGMNGMAFMMRTVTRHHKIGHEIKSGNLAGRATHFWNKVRSAAILKVWENIIGVRDFISNFDHTIEFPWPDLSRFDEVAWGGSNVRFTQWGGPVAQMMVAKGVVPFLPTLLRANAEADRTKVAAFVEGVINAAFKPPVPVSISWSNLIFSDPRLQSELIKFGVQQGYVSIETAMKVTGLNAAQEGANKVREAADPDATAKFRPMWDMSHALSPAEGETSITAAAAKTPTDKQNGHPPGTPNAS
jgi:hypothetical protein